MKLKMEKGNAVLGYIEEPAKTSSSSDDDLPAFKIKKKTIYIPPKKAVYDKDPNLHEFTMDGESFKLISRSLLIFGPENCLRLSLMRVCRSDWFNNSIMVVILLNSISIAITDSSQRN